MNFKLNPALDLSSLKASFNQTQKLRITDILNIEDADRILDTLEFDTPWHLVYSDPQGLPIKLAPADLQEISEDKLIEITNVLHHRAADSYQYTYKYYPIIDAIKNSALSPQSVLYNIAHFINGTEFIGFVRALTNDNSIVKADPQATLYECGHFLTTHDDSNYQNSKDDPSSREYAFVFGFSKHWSADWGGQTSFFDSLNSHQSFSWNPGFNTLTIFKVPTLHCVNYVAPFAPRGRYSITGWLRSDPNIKRPDLGDI